MTTPPRQHALRCLCGQVQGYVELPALTGRAICYCRDCQAYAHHLQQAEQVLDAAGGTDIIAMLPRQLRFTSGLDKIACVSLSDTGLLRWYAECCRAPLGNTPRDPKVPYIGLVHTCLKSQPLEADFGAARAHLHPKSARVPGVKATPLALAASMFTLMRAMLPARLRGAENESPLFRSGRPIRAPHVLSAAERAAAFAPLR